MTQDPYGQPPGSGHVVRGEVVPDDEADVDPMTHFQKVASALRGDRTDPAMPAVPEADPGSPDPNGTRPDVSPAAGTTSPDAPEAVRDGADSQEADLSAEAAHPDEVGAVRSPDDESHDYWDEAEAGRNEASASASPQSGPAADADAGTLPTRPDGQEMRPDEQDPTMTQPDLYGSAARRGADAAPVGAAGLGATGLGATGLGATDAGAAGAVEPGAAGAVEAGTVGKHSGAPAQEGLRPGETDGGFSDFSDLTYGSLLPDAAEFKVQWQQVQFRFVDDPQGSVTDAANVISQVTAKLEAAIAERQRAIAERQRTLRDRWSEGKSTDTESLRETLLMYRTFLDQLTGPKAG
jgi:hypothetical protein